MRFEILEKSWLFRGLQASQIEALLRDVPYAIKSYEKGETVFQPMEKADRVGIILRGKIQSFKLFPNGNQVNVTIRQAGEVIGPAAVFSAHHKYPFGVAALEYAEVLMLHREGFLQLLRKDWRLAENALLEISSITFLLQQRLELMSYHGIDQKIAFYLLNQSMHKDSLTVLIPGSMTKWALMMNVSRPSLYRELARLEKQGLLQFLPPEIKILDETRLEGLLYK